jgi:magnesium transporter
MRMLVADGSGPAEAVSHAPPTAPDAGWVWIDVVAGLDDVAELLTLTAPFQLDRLAVRDAVADVDYPKADDFGNHLLMVVHGLRRDAVTTFEVDCFITERVLVTIRDTESTTIDALWAQAQHRSDIARLAIDEVAALLADMLTRRLLSVLDAFDSRIEDLTGKALSADQTLLEDLTAVRTDLAGVRRVVHPQREMLDLLRHSPSALLTDVFDVASRLTGGLDEARAAIAETLDAYRGAEARQATEVSKVLTVYAAIMLPLSLIAGFFGMNFVNLPWMNRSWGWMVVTAVMVLIALVSLGIFISLGWVRRPTGRRAGQVLGHGLLEATRAPAQIMGTMLEMGSMPLRATGVKFKQAIDDGAETDTNHGSE